MKASSPCLMVLLLALASARILENRPDRNLVPPSQQNQNVTSLKNNANGPAPLSDHPHQNDSNSSFTLNDNGIGKAGKLKSKKNVKVDKRSARLNSKQSHHSRSAKKASKKERKERKLTSASSGRKPERKLYYVLNKPAQKPNAQNKPQSQSSASRQLKQKPSTLKPSDSFKKLAQKPQVKSNSKPIAQSSTPQPSLKKSFVVSKNAVRRVRKLVEGEQDGERKLQSIPLLLFGDYEIIIEKK